VAEHILSNREARKQHPTNRQLSMVDENPERQKVAQEIFSQLQAEVAQKCKDAYELALNSGIAKEQARAFLPEGLTETTLYMSGSLRSWVHYCQLRMGNGTQKEHMDIAKQCWNIITGHFPSIAEAVND